MSDNYISQDEVVGKIRDGRSLRYLLNFCSPEKYKFFISVTLITISSMLAIGSSRLLGYLVEHGLTKSDIDASWKIAGIIVFVEAVAILISWFGRRILAKAACSSILLIRKKLFSHIHALPMSYYDRQPQGRTITRITYDVEGIEEFITGSMARVVTALFTFVIAIIAMVITDWKLGIMAALAMVPAVVFTIVTRDRIRTLNREVSTNNSACNATLAEFINGISVIRAFGLEDWTKKRYQNRVDNHVERVMVSNFFYSWTRPLTILMCEFPIILLFLFGGKAVIDGQMNVGIFVSFIGYCNRFSNPLMVVSREIAIILQAFTASERVTSFLQAKTEDDELGLDGKIQNIKLKGEIEFKNVEMSYDQKTQVLKKLNFKIHQGEKIGLVGRTGCGKTSTVSLLSRLYEYQKGEILIDGTSIRDFHRNFLRDRIGFVSQDVILFRGSLRENLTCEMDIEDNDIIQACRLTGLIKVMENNKIDLNFQILDQGANLSSGERQLISLTRVLLRAPTLLILDEATANIDSHYEELIHKAVDQIMQDRTCIIIAHRLETLKSCDRIFVFNQGELVEVGQHHELMAQKGYFYNLQTNAEAQII